MRLIELVNWFDSLFYGPIFFGHYDSGINIKAIAPKYHCYFFGGGFTNLPLEVGGEIKRRKINKGIIK